MHSDVPNKLDRAEPKLRIHSNRSHLLTTHHRRSSQPAAGLTFILIVGMMFFGAVTVLVSKAHGQSKEPGARIETVIVTIRRSGFEPAEIERPKGLFLLSVNNRSGLQEVLLRLDRDAGSRVQEQRVPREKLDWHEPLDLEPGRYILSEANHPSWVCRLIITAH